MAKISREEYWFLRGLDDGWKWLARDKDTDLWVFGEYPIKHEDFWDEYSGVCEIVDSDLFQFIQWDDEEPHNIQELIREYENWVKDYEVDWDKVFGRASEETEVKKDKKWLIDKLTKERNETDVYDPEYQYLSEFIAEVSQLDEPEVLSADWIKDNQLMWTSLQGAEYYVPTKKLYGKIVQKQEEIRVPKWFAEWFEGRGYEMSLYGIFNDLYTNSKSKMEEWSNRYEMGHAELQNDIASIKLHGKGIYEVEEEEEPKYYVDLDTAAYVAKWEGNNQVGIYTDSISGSDEFEFHLTEREIKDYDERFWPFRKPVEETE